MPAAPSTVNPIRKINSYKMVSHLIPKETSTMYILLRTLVRHDLLNRDREFWDVLSKIGTESENKSNLQVTFAPEERKVTKKRSGLRMS